MGRGVEFMAGADVVGLYNELHVYDAKRRELPARFTQTAESSFAIEVDDTGATYPVLIDPTLMGDGNITNPTTGSGFGYSIAFYTDVYAPTHWLAHPIMTADRRLTLGKPFSTTSVQEAYHLPRLGLTPARRQINTSAGQWLA